MSTLKDGIVRVLKIAQTVIAGILGFLAGLNF